MTSSGESVFPTVATTAIGIGLSVLQCDSSTKNSLTISPHTDRGLTLHSQARRRRVRCETRRCTLLRLPQATESLPRHAPNGDGRLGDTAIRNSDPTLAE
jgi:hypothetical protein